MDFLQQKRKEKENLAIHFSFGIFLVFLFLSKKTLNLQGLRIYTVVFLFFHIKMAGGSSISPKKI